MRKFEDKEAIRERVPISMAFVGPTGSGKTGSALEVAHGFQDVLGGDIGVMDTEARRSLAYAGAPMFSDPSRNFKFRFMDFKAPFGPKDYEAACEHFIKKGIKHILVDSASHMWEGTGGVLQMHQAECERLQKAWHCGAEKANFPAWNAAKTAQTNFINYMKQQGINFFFCFRAKEKMKMIKVDEKVKPVQIGWQPIGGEDLLFEMSLACLLRPECDGQPIWNKKEELGVKALHAEFRPIFKDNPRLSIEVGRKLAEWAKGGEVVENGVKGQPDAAVSKDHLTNATKAIQGTTFHEDVTTIEGQLGANRHEITDEDWVVLTNLIKARKEVLV